jgi:hypothetical protein
MEPTIQLAGNPEPVQRGVLEVLRNTLADEVAEMVGLDGFDGPNCAVDAVSALCDLYVTKRVQVWARRTEEALEEWRKKEQTRKLDVKEEEC